MLRYGLTGGIASGKSVVAAFLREEGFQVLEADKISHQLMERRGTVFTEVVSLLGKRILDENGSIDRGLVAKIVFGDREKLNELNAIVHPHVEQELLVRFEELEKSGNPRAAFVEAALVFEAGMDKRLDGVVVAWCLPEQQLARLIARGLSEAEARKRIELQLPVSEKLARATDKIDCSGSLEETRRQVTELAAKARNDPEAEQI